MCKFKSEKHCKEASLKINARYFCGSQLALGNVTNISKNCMCINTMYCIPLKSMFKLFLTFKRKVLDIPVRVSSYTDANSHHDTMIVDILNPPQQYLELFQDSSGTLKT